MQTVDGETTTYSYNALDQLTSDGEFTYTYNARGNLETVSDGEGTAAYTWDARDRMISASVDGVSVISALSAIFL